MSSRLKGMRPTRTKRRENTMTVNVRPIRTAAETALTDSFAAVKAKLPGKGDIAKQREAAFGRFEAQGLPHRHLEEWKYTDLRALMREARPLAPAPGAAEKVRAKDAGKLAADIDARRLVFVNGAFVAEHSDLAALESGLTITSTAKVLADGDRDVVARLGAISTGTGDAAVALNTAFMGDGAIIRVAPGVALQRPIHIVFLYAGDRPASMFTRSLAVIGHGARAMFVESHEGPSGCDYQVNTMFEIAVGDEAHVDHVKITGEGASAFHISTLMADIGARARFNEFAFTMGGAVVRNQMFVRCNGADSILKLSGASILRDKQHADTTLVVDHAIGGCESREMFKSVLDDESRVIFQGKIVVRPDAQKSDARMATHALLLSDMAEADAKPELEIFADNVQCGHGATSGAIDENLKFYLMARGIPEKEAEALLIESFIGEAMESIEHAGLRELLMDAVREWLKARQ